MELLLIRHAQARSEAPSGLDADRSLSERGVSRFGESVTGLVRMGWGLDGVLTSPWRRAVETAELLSPLLRGGGSTETCEALVEPPGKDLLAAVVKMHATCETARPKDAGSRVIRLALVGHEPWMALLCSWLLTADKARHANLSFKKGGVAWLDGQPRPAGMLLRAFLPPVVTREIGR